VDGWCYKQARARLSHPDLAIDRALITFEWLCVEMLSEEEMMKTRNCLKIFGSLNYFVELFKVQSSPNPLIVT
jgi:hypothetical protein